MIKVLALLFVLSIVLCLTSCITIVIGGGEKIPDSEIVEFETHKEGSNTEIYYTPKIDNAETNVVTEETGRIKNFIDDIAPYAKKGSTQRFTTEDGKSKEIAGVIYDNYIKLTASYDGIGKDNYLLYNLGGKYNTIKLKAYSDGKESLLFYGDDDKLLEIIKVKEKELPIDVMIDVTGVKRLKIKGEHRSAMTSGTLYIVDATIE